MKYMLMFVRRDEEWEALTRRRVRKRTPGLFVFNPWRLGPMGQQRR